MTLDAPSLEQLVLRKSITAINDGADRDDVVDALEDAAEQIGQFDEEEIERIRGLEWWEIVAPVTPPVWEDGGRP